MCSGVITSRPSSPSRDGTVVVVEHLGGDLVLEDVQALRARCSRRRRCRPRSCRARRTARRPTPPRSARPSPACGPRSRSTRTRARCPGALRAAATASSASADGYPCELLRPVALERCDEQPACGRRGIERAARASGRRRSIARCSRSCAAGSSAVTRRDAQARPRVAAGQRAQSQERRRPPRATRSRHREERAPASPGSSRPSSSSSTQSARRLEPVTTARVVRCVEARAAAPCPSPGSRRRPGARGGTAECARACAISSRRRASRCATSCVARPAVVARARWRACARPSPTPAPSRDRVIAPS